MNLKKSKKKAIPGIPNSRIERQSKPFGEEEGSDVVEELFDGERDNHEESEDFVPQQQLPELE